MDALEAVKSARELGQTEAIVPGASGGAVMAALAADAPSFQKGEEIVVILHDGGMPYTNTIYSDAWVEENLHATLDN